MVEEVTHLTVADEKPPEAPQVQGSGFGGSVVLVFRVQGLGVQGLGFRVQGFRGSGFMFKVYKLTYGV